MERAVIFDFDGLVLDTETPLFEAWHRTFVHFGAEPIDVELWCAGLGLHDDDPDRLDPHGVLCARLGRDLPAEEVHAVRRLHRDELLAVEAVQDGVVELLDRAGELGLRVGIATSSPVEWIEAQLGPRGLRPRFEAVACAGDGVPGKPAPDTYLEVCRLLGVEPADALALEDSPNGVRAAKAAGLTCIAVPTPLGAGLDLSQADAVVGSLTEVDLRRWLAG